MLDTPLSHLPGIGSKLQRKLKKLKLQTVRDLLFHFPHRYEDFSNLTTINKAKINQNCCLRGEITRINSKRTWKKKIFLTEALVRDATGEILVIWFNRPYLQNVLKEKDQVLLAGKILRGPEGIYLSNPSYEKIQSSKFKIQNSIHTGRLVPVYPETEGLSSRWLRAVIYSALKKYGNAVKETLPPSVIKNYKLPNVTIALWQAHFPKSLREAENAKRRFAFQELFHISTFVLREKSKIAEHKAPTIPLNLELVQKAVKALPFSLTDAQKKSLWQILKDLEKPKPMNRLLQGDVGSGKTVVALVAALNVIRAGHQVVFMAPTEILSRQHFKTAAELLSKFHCRIGLLTGKTDLWISPKLPNQPVEISRKKLLEKTVNGEIDLLCGTHALIQDKVKFAKLALVILDEQHRFGVEQRAKLVARGRNTELTRNYTENYTENYKNYENYAENSEVGGGLIYEDLTYKIRGAAFEVRKALGGGHSETIYQRALAEELNNAGLLFSREQKIDILYKNKKIGVYQPDFVVENKIIVELKAMPFLGTTVKSQVWKYLRGSGYKVALILNFGAEKLEIERLVYNKTRISSIQRSSASIPHLLSMTATPIPRTLALTIYGDLDLSLIDELPRGRKKIITRIVPPAKRQAAYQFIRQEVKKGRQVFVVCPRIEKSQIPNPKSQINSEFQTLDSKTLSWSEAKAVKEEYEKLSKDIFPDLRVAMLHGKMTAKEKDKIMSDFGQGKVDVLVSTSVIEVGVDVPNATLMIIEGAERFGLAQLHQFRGRVGRAEHQSYCLLFTESPAKNTRLRLKALLKCENGFELAEKDLAIRGPGDFAGTRQWGMPDMVMEALKDLKLVQEAREAAKENLIQDPYLQQNPALRAEVEKFRERIHLE